MLWCSCVLMFVFSGQGGNHLSPLQQQQATDAGSALKYQPQPGGDTLSDFVTLVCQEARNAQQVNHKVKSQEGNGMPLIFPLLANR